MGEFAARFKLDIDIDFRLRLLLAFPRPLLLFSRSFTARPPFLISLRTFCHLHPVRAARPADSAQTMNSSRSRNPTTATMADMGRGGYDTTGTPKPPRNHAPR